MSFGLNSEQDWQEFQKIITDFTFDEYNSDVLNQEIESGLRKDIKTTFLMNLPIQYSYGQINLPLNRLFLVQGKNFLPYIEFYKYIKNSNEYNINVLLEGQEQENVKLKISSKPYFNKNIVLELDRINKNNIYLRQQRFTYDIKNSDNIFTEAFEEFFNDDQLNPEHLEIFNELYRNITDIKFSDLEIIQDDKQKKIMIDRIFDEYYNNDNQMMIFFINKFFNISGFSYIDETIDFYLPILWRIYIISKYQKGMSNEEVLEISNGYFEQILKSELNLTFQDLTNKNIPFNIEKFIVLRNDKLDSFEKQFDPYFFKIKFLTSQTNNENYLKYFESKNQYQKWNKFFLQDLFLRGKISLDSLQNYLEQIQEQLNENFTQIEFFTDNELYTKYYKLLLQTLYEDKLPVLEFLIRSENKMTNYPICMNENDIEYYEVYDYLDFVEKLKKNYLLEQMDYRIEYDDVGSLPKQIEQTFLLNIPIMKTYEGKIVIPLKVPSSIQFESPFRIKKSKFIEIVTQSNTYFVEILENNTIQDIKTKQIIGEFNPDLNLLVFNKNDGIINFESLHKIFFDIEFDVNIKYTDQEIKDKFIENLSEDDEFIYFDLPLNKQFRLKRNIKMDMESEQEIPQETIILQEQEIVEEGEEPIGDVVFSFEIKDLFTKIKPGSISIKIDGEEIQVDDGKENIIGEYLNEPISGSIDYNEGTIDINSIKPIQPTSNVTLDYSLLWESNNIYNIERNDKMEITIGQFNLYIDNTNNLYYDKNEYDDENEVMNKKPINVGKYLEKERRIIIKKYFDNKIYHDYEDESLIQDVYLDDEMNISLNVVYTKDWVYYIFQTLFQEYNYWYNTFNYRDKTSQFIYNKYSVSQLRDMDYFQLQHLHKEILYRMIFDVYFVNENHYNKQGCIFNQLFPSSLNKLNEHLFEMNNFVNIITDFDIFYFDFKKIFKLLDIYTPQKFVKYNEEKQYNENISVEEKRRLLISLCKENLLFKLNDSLNTDNQLNPFFDQNRYILSSQGGFNSNKLNNFILYNYNDNKIQEIEKNSNFLFYFPQFQLDFKYDYQFKDTKEMNIDIDNLNLDVFDTIKVIKLGTLEGLIKQGTSYFNFKW